MPVLCFMPRPSKTDLQNNYKATSYFDNIANHLQFLHIIEPQVTSVIFKKIAKFQTVNVPHGTLWQKTVLGPECRVYVRVF